MKNLPYTVENAKRHGNAVTRNGVAYRFIAHFPNARNRRERMLFEDRGNPILLPEDGTENTNGEPSEYDLHQVIPTQPEPKPSPASPDLEPFDIEKFKAGRKAIRRDGRVATFEVYMDSRRTSWPLIATTEDGNPQFYADNGRHNKIVEYDSDLIWMEPLPEPMAFVNIYPGGAANWHPTREEAEIFKVSTRITCVEVKLPKS